MEAKLARIGPLQNDVVNRSFSSYEVCKKVHADLKQKIMDYQFAAPEEEIAFFKTIKPKVVSKMILYTKIYMIEIRKPVGSVEVRKDYLLCELDKLKHFFDENIELILYYRSGSVHLDHQYFLRGVPDSDWPMDRFNFDIDPRFSTSHDYKISKIIAFEQLQHYLLLKLDEMNGRYLNFEAEHLNLKLKWTDSKFSLTELLYALYYAGVFENGKCSLTRIAQCFEKVFDISLEERSRIYMDIKGRKTGKTKFLDQLKVILTKKIDEED